MIVSINQPAYLPWLGYFDRIARSDLHIVLDHVQFEKNSMSNRNKIRMPQGWSWLTLPLRTAGRFGDLDFRGLELAEGDTWPRKHLTSLVQQYRRAAFFAEHRDWLETVYRTPPTRFLDLVEPMTVYQMRALGIRTPLRFSSELGVAGTKGELVLNLCRSVGATTYLSGPFGRDYLPLDEFARANIRVVFHDYRHPVYAQTYPGFEPYMATLDLLFNHGPQSLQILQGENDHLRAELAKVA